MLPSINKYTRMVIIYFYSRTYGKYKKFYKKNIPQMNKKQRVNWFILCRNLTLSDMAKAVGVTEQEAIRLIKGEIKDTCFALWVKNNLGKPYWL